MAISMAIGRAARHLIHRGAAADQGVLNMIEMAFRAYDPCFGCATHSLGRLPLEVRVHEASGAERVLRRP